MKIKLLGLALATGLLTACGGSGDGAASSSKNATLADMVGVWNFTETKGGKEDVAYYVVHSDGKPIIYDYMGDASDEGEKCYIRAVGATLKDLGNGRINNGENIAKVTVSGNSMSIEIKSGSEVTKSTYYRAPKKESDFKPICTA